MRMLARLQEEDLTEAEKRFRRERGGGNYGLGTKEVQEKRYIERREAERKRRELFNDALAMYKQGVLENVRLMQVQKRAALVDGQMRRLTTHEFISAPLQLRSRQDID